MKRKSTEQLTKDLESIIKRLYQNEGIEAVREIVEDTLLQSEKDRITQGTTNTKKDRIIEMARDLKAISEISKEIQCSDDYVRAVMSKGKIYSRRRVQKLIQEGKIAEDIAAEGNVNLDAVIKLAEQQKERKKGKTKKKESFLASEKIVSMAANLTSPKEIAAATYSEVPYVYGVMKEKGIYTIRKVTELIKLGKTLEEIAREGNVNLDAVIKLKEKLENEKTRKKEEAEKKQQSKDSKENRRKRVKLDEQKRKQIIKAAKDLKSGVEIESITQISYAYIKKIMDEEWIFTRAKVKQLIKDGKTPEEIAKEGNVNLDAVISLKNELEQLRRKKEACTQQVSVRAVYGERKIIALIETGKTDREIADLGNVSIERVKAIRKQLEQGPHQQEANSITGDIRVINGQNEYVRVPRQYSNKASIATKTVRKNTSGNNTILQMARQVKSINKIVSTLGISEYTIRNLLRKYNILPREDIIFLINQGEKTPQEIAKESGCDLHQIEKLYYRIAELTKTIEQDPKRKRALELLQKGMSESQIAATIRLSKEAILEMKEFIVGRVEKPISEERKKIDFKIDILNLRASINSMLQPSKTYAETTDLKIQKILYKYPEFIGRREYAFFAYAYVKASEYMKAIDIGEEYLGLDTPSISALKTKIEEILQEEKEKKEGQYVGDSTEDGYPGR